MDIDPNKIHYVYGLHYPDGRLFYVGKGKNRRMYDHVPAARSNRCHNKHLQHTILNIEGDGGSVVYKKFFCGLSEHEASLKEKCLIHLFGRRHNKTGFLVNIADGGEGSAGHKLTPEQCKAMSERNKGKTSPRKGAVLSEETKEKIRAARAKQTSPMKGRKHSEETKEKIRQVKTGVPSGRKGMPHPKQGHTKGMNDKWRGSKQTPEVIELIRAASKARWQDPEYRQKRADSMAAYRKRKSMEVLCQSM